MHRRVVFALVLAVLAFVVVGSSTAASRGTLRVVDPQPLALRGLGFHPAERVHVVIHASVTAARDVRASQSGAFTARFAGVLVPRCGGVFARARGSRGTLATLKIPLPACLPAAQP